MSCNVVSPYNIVSIDPQNSYIIEVSTPGPQGPPGPSGSIPDTGSFATTGSNTFRGNQVISGSVTISGSVLIISPNTFTNVGPAIFSGSIDVFSGSLTLTSGSFIADGESSFTGSLFGTASFADIATFATTSSYALNFNPSATASYAEDAATSSFQTNIYFAPRYIPLFDTTSSLSSSALHQSNSYSIIINREFGTALNPEALFVFQPNTESINIATFESNVDNYSQINVRNESAGPDASSDIVATANNGDEFYYYINMGINGSNYSPGYLGGPNDTYVYSLAKNFHIGNAASDGSHLAFFVGGDNVDTYTKLILRGNNQHALTGSLKILNDLWVVGSITGSISGSGVGHFSGSFAGDGSQLINIPASSVVGLNLSQISSGSATASISPTNGFVVNTNTTISGSTIVRNNFTAGHLLTNQHSFTGSVNITGSLSVNGVSFEAQTGGYLAIWRYTSSFTTNIDPGNGYFKLNNSWPLAPTVAAFDDFAYDPNVLFSSYLDSLGAGTIIKLVSLSSPSTYKILQVTSTIPYQSGYEAYSVTQIASSGPDPNDGDQFAFIPVGSPGAGFDAINNAAPGRVIVSDGSTNAATASTQLLITESVVRFATQSFNPTGSIEAGSIWFTSSSFYVGLE
jgi:hypothetical protein